MGPNVRNRVRARLRNLKKKKAEGEHIAQPETTGSEAA